MSDWEIAPKAVTENNLKQYAGIQNGYADGVNNENPDTELNSINAELAKPDLHPVARKALLEAKAGLSSDSGWEVAPKGSPSDAGTDKSTGADSGWSVAPASTGEIAKGIGEAGLNFVSGIPAAMGGGLTYLGALAGSGGDLNAAMAVKQDTEKAINDKIQYEPRTKMGKQIQGDISQGMEDAINLGGESAKSLVGAIPFVGKDLAKDNEVGLEALGKAGTEMALNVIDPLAMLGGFKAGAHSKAIEAPAAKLEAIAKIENSVPPLETPKELSLVPKGGEQTGPLALVPKEGEGQPPLTREQKQAAIQTEIEKANAPEAAPTYPIEQPPADPHAPLQYTKEFPFGLEDQASTSPQKGFNFGEKPSELSLVPKEFKPDDTMPNPENGQVAEAFKKAQEAEAYKQLEETATAQKDAHYQQLEQQAIAERHGELDYQILEGTGDHERKFLERSDDDALTRIYNDAYAKLRASGHTDSAAYETTKTITDIRVKRQLAEMARNNQGKINDIHPGYKQIPAGTKIEFVRNGETFSGTVVDSKFVKTVYGGQFIPRVELPDGAHMRAFEGDIKRVFGGPKKIDYSPYAGDKSLMSKDKTLEMRAHLRRGDVMSVLKTLADNHPIAAYRDLARYLSDKMNGLKVKLHDESILKLGDRDVTGYYDPSTSTVGFSGLGATSPHTVLHEFTHAVTSKFINERPNDVRVTGLKNLFNQLNNEGKFKDFSGIVNPKEFVAEAFSNPKFQEFLKTQYMNNKTVWQRFVDGVKSIFGIRTGIETNLSNAFEHAMDLGKQIVEAQDTKASVLDQFKKANVPNKLADLMAQKPKDTRPEVLQNEAVRDIVKGLPGLEHAVSDFAFYDKPIEEIVKMARDAPDIPSTTMEKVSQQIQGGALFESLKTRNPVVKYTYERITRAFQEAAHNVKTNLTDPVTGIKSYMRALSPDEKGEAHALMMLHEGQKELSSTELAAAGFNEKQIAYYNKQRELDNQFFNDLNARRAEMGLTPMDKRVAHLAGRFMGDFARMVFKDGKVVGRISGNTHWELNKVTKYMQEEHPEWTFGDREYNKIGHGRGAKDRFAGLMEAINFIEKADGDVKALMDSYRGYMQKDAVNYLNATRHAKAKVKEAGGIVGSEGNKPWLDTIKNAEEGMKAQLAYFEQGYQWMAMEKAVGDIKKVLGDEEVVKNSPNAVKYADAYKDHAMGRNQGVFADASNTLLSHVGQLSGIGHSNLMALNGTIKHLVMQKFMGFMNIPFSLTQLMQPLQTQPAMIRLMRNRGLEFSTVHAQLKATETYLKSMLDPHMDGTKMSDFERAAVKYADEMSVFDVKMSDHTKDINVSRAKETYDKIADLNITAPEHITRGTTFLFYAHALKDAGIPAKDIFGAAENMTNLSMVNYHQIERPMGYAKLGWIGDVASTLTRYKHNQYSQAAFYAREGIRGENGAVRSYGPLATFVGTSLAFGGMMGFFAYQEADSLYQLFTEHVLRKPDSLTNVVMSNNTPEYLSHGLFSTLGMDMTTRFSNANLVPNSIPEALMPYGSAVLDMAQTTGRFAIDPTNEFKFKQAVKSIAPQSTQGLAENLMFTDKTKDGKNLYINSTDGPNLGKGRVIRTDDQMTKRAFGFRDVTESKELAKNYSDSQIEKANSNLVDKLLTKTKYDILGSKITDAELSDIIKKAAGYGEDPNAFVGKLTQWSMDRQLTQSQQQLLRNAQKGYKGAFNIKAGR